MTTNKAEIARLQDEITLEKSKAESVQGKLEEASAVLREIGYNPDKLSEATPVSDRE